LILCVVLRIQAIVGYDCQPAATWQPFVLKAHYAELPANVTLEVSVLSNFTWCMTRPDQLAAVEVASNGGFLESNTKLFTIQSAKGSQLMVINAQVATNPGGQLQFVDATSKFADTFSRHFSALLVTPTRLYQADY
jgi:hypothetical protein